MRRTKNISAFNYFGGKNNPQLLQWIHSKLNLLPVFHLAEPFSGSAAVALNYKSAKIRTINDLNSDIFNFFKVLRENGDQLIQQLELTPHCREEYESVFMDETSDPIERARVFFLRTNQSFGNSGGLKVYNSWSYTINDQRYKVSQSTARYLNKIEGLQKAANELRHIQVEHLDFREFIKKYDGKNTVFYVDPPYVPESRSYNIKYKHELTIDDHIQLSEILKKIKGKFLLSGYHSDLYNVLYAEFSTCQMGGVKTAGVDAVEVLWANYDLNANTIFLKMKCAHLFNGIGGFALAAHWMGWQNVMHCEIDPFCNQVMNYYFPKSFQHEDIKTTNFTFWRGKIDILTGGFPCQGFSTAGYRKGTDDHRYLWPQNFRAIKEIRPPWVVCENVAGITSMEDKSGIWKEVFAKVESRKIIRYKDCDIYEALLSRQSKMLIATICEDLESEGYAVQPFIIPAAGIGAPHRRDRIWIIAYSSSFIRDTKGFKKKIDDGERQMEKSIKKGAAVWNGPNSNGEDWITTNSQSKRLQQEGQNVDGHQEWAAGIGGQRFLANSDSRGQQGSRRTIKPSDSEALKHWKASWAVDVGRWPTVSPVCNRNDGVSHGLVDITFSKWREQALKGGGNAIVPQVAEQIYHTIAQYLNT